MTCYKSIYFRAGILSTGPDFSLILPSSFSHSGTNMADRRSPNRGRKVRNPDPGYGDLALLLTRRRLIWAKTLLLPKKAPAP